MEFMPGKGSYWNQNENSWSLSVHGFTLYTLYYIYYCKILTILWKEVDVVKPKICGSFPASWGQIHNHVMIKRKLKDVLGFNQFFTIAFSGNLINSSKLIVLFTCTQTWFFTSCLAQHLMKKQVCKRVLTLVLKFNVLVLLMLMRRINILRSVVNLRVRQQLHCCLNPLLALWEGSNFSLI